jgi:hypothetical protein
MAVAFASDISYAGYGVYNQTIDVTDGIKIEYGKGERVFLASNQFGDPAPGERKYLYIVWKVGAQLHSGVTGENDKHGITLP